LLDFSRLSDGIIVGREIVVGEPAILRGRGDPLPHPFDEGTPIVLHERQ